MRAPLLIALAAYASACASDVRSLPEPTGAPQAVAVIAGGSPRRATVAPYAAGQPAQALRPEDTDEPLHTLYFAEPLPWAAGTYVESSDGWGRALPTPVEAFAGSWDGGAWSTTDPALLVAFVMPLESPITCAERGGCFADPDATTCTTPCPAPPEPVPPAPPLAPQYGPCPAGWTEDGATSSCRAYTSGPPVCAPGELRGAGGACTPVGTACAGTFAPGLDDARTLFVRPGAVGGDGSRASPLATLGEALGAAAAAGTTIALSTGDHPAPASIDRDRRVVGACAADTRLVSSAALTTRGDVRLEALSVVGPSLIVAADGALSLDGVRLLAPLDVRERARVVVQQTALGDRVDVGPGATFRATGSRMPGLGATASASVSIDRSWLDGTLTTTGARVSLLASVVRPRVYVRDGALTIAHAVVDAGPEGEPGLVTHGAVEVVARRLVASGSGLRFGPSATVLLEDLRIDDAPAPLSRAVVADDVALTIRRVRFGEGFDKFVRATNVFAPVVLEDLVTPPGASYALELRAPRIELRRVRLINLSTLQIGGPPPSDGTASIELEDVSMHDGLLRLRDAGKVRIRRGHFSEMRGSGLVVDASPAAPDLEASDVVVEDTRKTTDCASRVCVMGSGIMMEGGSLVLSRFRFRGNAGPALLLQTLRGELDVQGGTIEGQALGILMELPAPLLRDALVGVRLEDVDQVCEPCGSAAPR